MRAVLTASTSSSPPCPPTPAPASGSWPQRHSPSTPSGSTAPPPHHAAPNSNDPRNLLRHNKRSYRPAPANSERKRRIAHSPARPAARGRKPRMSTQPGIAFVTGASCDLGRNEALDLADPPHERGDAARNRALLVDAARRLVATRGPETVTMDEIAASAGVGKGTLFRRFGSRAGLMI